ncbi:hypothetical protein PHYSODRAFT_483119, partial [Phytophthora sojae]
MSTTNYPEVPRRIDLTLGPLVVYLSEGDGSADTTVRAPALKLIGLKINAESTISAEDSSHDSADEIIETDTQEPVLRLRSTISGENRALEVILSKRVEPWIASGTLVYDQEVSKLQEDDASNSYVVETQDNEWSILDNCECDLDAHFKLMKTEVTFVSLERTCDVLPKGVPSIQLSIGEVTVYGHPFMSEDHLGVRAKADIQCSRLKACYFTSDNSIKLSFLSLDFARVFISPVATMMQSEVPAEVEMEAEWIEVKWAPEVLHAIGGLLELGIATSSLKVPAMHQLADVAQDTVSPGEVIAFRCTAKRICVTFPYVYYGQRHVECVTVDTFAMSTEGTTERLRISILDARVFPNRRASSEKASTVHAEEICGHDATYFVADCFSIEENKVPGSSKTVVDLFVNGARMEWDIATQLRVMELIRRITFSSWEMIYRARSAYALRCTRTDSIYNRSHGLNPPLDDVDECLRYERMFGDLISASGDKLHRLHATNLSVHAKLCGEVDVQLAVGMFAGDDLPEVWAFDDVSLQVNGLDMVSAGSVRVRHTINKQIDYVYGEFEDMLRKRLSACRRSTVVLDESLTDGILIHVNKLRLCTSCDFPLQPYVDAIQTSFDPFKQELTAAAVSFWRPQHELFYQFFLRTPVASHQMEAWMRLENVVCECLGNPLESWLERMYPVWVEELAEQELRAHMLDDH